MKYHQQIIHVNGVNINVLVEGKGEAVLLLHCIASDSTVWYNQIKPLVDAGFKVIIPDLRGFGVSDAPEWKENYEISKLMGDILAIMKEFDIKKFNLVSHGFSSIIGWNLSSKYPEMVLRYVVISMGVPMIFETGGLEQLQKGWFVFAFQISGLAEKSISDNNWKILRETFNYHPHIDNVIANLADSKRTTAAMNWYRANLPEIFCVDYAALQLPVMGLWGVNDPVFTEKQMLETAKYVTEEWEYHQIDNASYWPQMDNSVEVNKYLLKWLLHP